MKRIAILFILLFAASCSKHDIALTGNKTNSNTIAYTKYNKPISGIYNLSPEGALSQSKNYCDSALSLAMINFLNGEYDKSKSKLETLRNSTICDSNIRYYANVLYQDIPQEDSIEILRSPLANIERDTLPIKMQGGLVTFTVDINGKEYCFLFDSGAQRSVFYNNVLTSFGSDSGRLNVSKKDVYDINNIAKVYPIIKLPMMRIGNTEIYNIRLFADSSQDKFTARNLFIFNILDIDGIIGWDVIKKLHWEIDSRNEVMVVQLITNQPVSDSKRKSLSWIYHPVVYLYDNDNYRYSFLFDLGATNSIFYPVFCTRFGLDLENQSRSSEKTKGINSSGKTEGFRIENVLLCQDQYELKFQNTFSPETNADGSFVFDGVLGADCYEAGKVIIDFPNRIFCIQPFNNAN